MNNDQLLIRQFIQNHPQRAISLIAEYSTAEIAALVLSLETEDQRLVFANLNSRKAAKAIEKMPQKEATDLLNKLAFQTAEAIFRNLTEIHQGELFKELPADLAKSFKRSLSYQKHQVGSHIISDVFYLQEEMKIKETIKALKEEQAEAHQHLFVLNQEGTVVGCLKTADLVVANAEQEVRSLMKTVPQIITADVSVKDVLENWNDSFYELPVTTPKGQFLGVISRQSIKGQEIGNKLPNESAVTAGSALADLYSIGLSSLLGQTNSAKKSN